MGRVAPGDLGAESSTSQPPSMRGRVVDPIGVRSMRASAGRPDLPQTDGISFTNASNEVTAAALASSSSQPRGFPTVGDHVVFASGLGSVRRVWASLLPIARGPNRRSDPLPAHRSRVPHAVFARLRRDASHGAAASRSSHGRSPSLGAQLPRSSLS